jgi:HPt (histidine-containing phosphotransfer) domain-containing protein
MPVEAFMNAQSDPLLDWDDLLERSLWNEDAARRVVAAFLDQMPGRIAALAEAAGSADCGGIRQAAHAIKGAALNVGAPGLSRLAKAIERQGEEGCLDGLAALLKALNESWENLQPVANPLRPGVPRSK